MAFLIFPAVKYPRGTVYMTVKNNDFPKYITLFCVYHKESALFQSDAVKPIRSGGARAKTSIGFLRDDTEDNISEKNTIYGELTANYWVWKNYLKRFPELQYVGFCHYRRFLGFKKPPGKGNAFSSMRFFAQFLLNFKKRYSQENILKYISGYDVILPGLTHFSTSVYDQYLEYHRKEDLDNMIKTVKTHYPEYEKSLNAVLGGKSIYACLNYVMKKHLFEEWMAFVFGVTEKLEKISDWKLLVLDKPTANLDFGNQVRALGTIRGLARQGYAVLMTSHSPDHAFLTAHEVLLLKDGAVFARGAPDAVIDDAVLSRLYDTPTVVARAPVAGGGCVKVCVPVLDDGENSGKGNNAENGTQNEGGVVS